MTTDDKGALRAPLTYARSAYFTSNKDMDTRIIYSITGPDNKKYIGQTSMYYRNTGCKKWRSDGLQRRWTLHLSDAYDTKRTTKIIEAIRTYGKDSFSLDTLQSCAPEMANEREKYYINLLNTIHPDGYNMQPGGSHGKQMQKQKKRQSKPRCVPNAEDTAVTVDRSALPLYINFMFCKKGYHSYIVRDTAKASKFQQKTFRSGRKSLEQVLEEAKTYLSQYVPEDEWIYDNKMVTTRSLHRVKRPKEEVLKELGIDKLPKYIYLSCSKSCKWYIFVSDARKPLRFAVKTYYPNEDRSLLKCFAEAQEYLDSQNLQESRKIQKNPEESKN